MDEARVPLGFGLSRAAALECRRYYADILLSVGAENCSIDLVPPMPGRRLGWRVELCRPADDPHDPIQEVGDVLSDLFLNSNSTR
jgi:hypothetical protein